MQRNYKAIILGPQCAGKTTLKKFFVESGFHLPLIEEDEMFVELNKGEYPKDIKYKENVLRPKLEDYIRSSDDLIFLTSYCNPQLIKELKQSGFKVVQLSLDKKEFDRRNRKRMDKQGYDDANEWAEEIFDFHKRVREEGLVDEMIDASKPTKEIAEEILSFLND